MKKLTALSLTAAIIVGSIVGITGAASATESDNPWVSTTAQVRGGSVQTGSTVTIDLQVTTKLAIDGPHLSTLTSPDRPDGTMFTCDDGVNTIPAPLPSEGGAFVSPDASAIGNAVNCVIIAPNSPGAHSLTFVWTDYDEDPHGESQVTVEWTTPELNAEVSVEKSIIAESGSVPGLAEPGETLTYQLRFTNTGNTAATLLASDILETVPANTTAAGMDDFACAAGAPGGTGCAAHADVTVPGGGESVDLTFRVIVDDPIPSGVTEVSNTVGLTGPDAPDCSAAPNACTVSIDTLRPSLSLDKSAAPTSVTAIGQQVGYSFRVTNTGNATVSDLVIDDVFTAPAGPALNITCATATLEPGDVVVCTAPYNATAADFAAGSIVNTATANGIAAGRPVSSNADDAVVTAVLPVTPPVTPPVKPTPPTPPTPSDPPVPSPAPVHPALATPHGGSALSTTGQETATVGLGIALLALLGGGGMLGLSAARRRRASSDRR
ncbi:hypothetical protein MUN77_15425 [Leucobacter allii]|uniref:DUF7507 domain-containing protein n=1 Tax=Leucobacter allii TaxID=2932247 RepID=UPI001FD18A9E|nr:hypothetical protein [Leucobacter allii]UOR01498.1 hypothetical protein MUN77_15425 [Leucobacter allii]